MVFNRPIDPWGGGSADPPSPNQGGGLVGGASPPGAFEGGKWGGGIRREALREFFANQMEMKNDFPQKTFCITAPTNIRSIRPN